MKKNIVILIVAACQLWMASACNQPASAAASRIRHLVEIENNGSVLYVDRVANNRVMKEHGAGIAAGSFATYKIGLNNKMPDDSKWKKDWSLHFEYYMNKDWVALVDGDSLHPVFYHPVMMLNSTVREGIIVFELPEASKQPDTLVYNDSFGSWQQQIIPLNQNRN